MLVIIVFVVFILISVPVANMVLATILLRVKPPHGGVGLALVMGKHARKDGRGGGVFLVDQKMIYLAIFRSPGKFVETYLHEWRHTSQVYGADKRLHAMYTASYNTRVATMKYMETRGGYSYADYRAEPHEVDARKYARRAYRVFMRWVKITNKI